MGRWTYIDWRGKAMPSIRLAVLVVLVVMLVSVGCGPEEPATTTTMPTPALGNPVRLVEWAWGEVWEFLSRDGYTCVVVLRGESTALSCDWGGR